jgi:hypothetical protein
MLSLFYQQRRKPMKKHRFLIRLMLFTLMVFWAWGSVQSHADDQWSRKRHPAQVRVQKKAYRPVVVKGHRYFYRQGFFYRHGPRGYVRERAPIGAAIVSLPFGFRTVGIGGGLYFEFGGTYYRRMPQGYVVVAPPVVNAPVVYQNSVQISGNVTVTAPLLNVRSGPGMSFGVLDRVRAGENLAVMNRSGQWLYVRVPSGQVGWVLEPFTVATSLPPSG